MKKIYFQYILFAFMYSCNSDVKTKSDDTTLDTLSVENNDTLNVNDEFTEIQSQVNNLIENITSSDLSKIFYNESLEYNGFQLEYFFENEHLKYLYYDWAVEGGDGGKIFVELKKGQPVILINANFFHPGYMYVIEEGKKIYYKLDIYDGDKCNIIQGKPDKTDETHESTVLDTNIYFTPIEEHKFEFTIINTDNTFKGKYEYYLYRDTVPSDYGIVQVSKHYVIDKELFLKKYLNNN